MKIFPVILQKTDFFTLFLVLINAIIQNINTKITKATNIKGEYLNNLEKSKKEIHLYIYENWIPNIKYYFIYD